MKALLQRFWGSARARGIFGGIAGAAGGAAYAHYIGCVTGSCPLTSNPFAASVFGAFFGASLLAPGRKAQPSSQPVAKP